MVVCPQCVPKASPSCWEAITDTLLVSAIEKLMNWNHNGFTINVGNRISRVDRDGQETLAPYVCWPISG